MEKITKENISLEYPNAINYDLLKEKGLGDTEPNERYFKLVNNYKSIFETYLKDILPLEQIDKNMKESKLKFMPIKEENMDYYQITSTMGLSYIYLRNDLHVEKLNTEDLDYLENITSLDDESKNFISRTYKKVINPYNESQTIFYGPENGKFLCDSNDIVIGIRYDEFDSELEDSEFEKNFIEQLKLINQVSTVLEIYGSDVLGSLKCIQYNEMSIMQLYNKIK